ncbi:MAG: DNA-3-methyladenine glycosylase [Actinomycetota bacterium]
MIRPVERELLVAPAPVVAPRLLNKLLVSGDTIGRIVEVEAYTPDDPASHSYRGQTPRTAPMFEQAGTLYCYLSYGIHVCANVVVDGDGVGAAVLVRAVEPVVGYDVMLRRRGGRQPVANGPGKLCQALAIDLGHNGLDLLDASSAVMLNDDGIDPPQSPTIGPRIGISVAVDVPWRWRVPG